MKKILFSMLVTFVALLDADAHAVSHAELKLKEIEAGQKEITLRKKPTYLSSAIIPSWTDNWFISVSGGARRSCSIYGCQYNVRVYTLHDILSLDFKIRIGV